MCKKFLQTAAVIGIISSGITLLAIPDVKADALCICTGTYLDHPGTAATCAVGAAGCAGACHGTVFGGAAVVAQTINCPNSCGDMQGKLCY